MFSQLSRYREVPDVVALDPRGRVLTSRDARPLPEVTGTFRHTVDAGDRLDQLAATYYGQPLQYWHICDANPQFLSPLALLGKEPVVTTRFPLTAPAGAPPWAALLGKLSGTVGVVDAAVSEEVTLVPQTQSVGGKPVTVVVEQFTRAVMVTYNRNNLDVRALREAIMTAGFAVGSPADGGQLGQQIVIPAAVNG
jgi:hypothetical protein